MASKQPRQAYRGNEKQGWPAWTWLGIGVVLGIALALFALIRDWAPLLHKSNLPQPNAQAVAPKASDQAVADAAKPAAPPKKTFDFYSVLPEMEVVIPDAELSAKARAEQARQALAASQAQAQPTGTPAGATPPASAESGGYMLLAGSYNDAHAADEAKAKLAMLGLIAKVQPVTINGKTWNRILLGPYADASATEAAKKTLSDNGVKAIPISRRPGE
jgi:cell division protein FtsN